MQQEQVYLQLLSESAKYYRLYIQSRHSDPHYSQQCLDYSIKVDGIADGIRDMDASEFERLIFAFSLFWDLAQQPAAQPAQLALL